MFEESDSAHGARERPRTLDALAASQDVTPTASVDDLAVDVWESDAELDAFLADVRHSRHADTA